MTEAEGFNATSIIIALMVTIIKTIMLSIMTIFILKVWLISHIQGQII